MSCQESNSLIMGTAPRIVLTFPMSVDFISKITIAFSQNDNIVINKKESDCFFEENRVIFELTQEETLKLDPNKIIEIQVKLLDNKGKPFVSRIERKRVMDVLDREVLE